VGVCGGVHGREKTLTKQMALRYPKADKVAMLNSSARSQLVCDDTTRRPLTAVARPAAIRETSGSTGTAYLPFSSMRRRPLSCRG
jgi:hypothetical protein